MGQSREQYVRRQLRTEKGLVAASVLPRLPYSTIDGGNLKVTNLNGDLVSVIGQQWDGTNTSSSVGGTPPPPPTVPLVTGQPGGLTIYWDGTYADDSPTRMDFKRVTFHAVTDVDDLDPLDPAQMAGEITFATGGETFAMLPPVEHFVFAVTWTESGLFSVESDVAYGTPTSYVDDAVLEDLNNSLDQLNNVTLPQLESDLAANSAAITDLNTNTLPNLQGDVDDALAAVTQAQIDAGNAVSAAQIASEKADAAEIKAIEKAWTNTNSTFAAWPTADAYPTGFTVWSSSPAPTKNTADALTKYAAQWAADATTQMGMYASGSFTALPIGLEFITLEFDVMLKSGTSFSGAGALVDWTGMTGTIRSSVALQDIVPTPVTGKWYRIRKVVQRPTAAAGTQTSWTAWLMANFAANGLGALTVKNIVFDRFAVRPSNSEEISSYVAGGWRLTGKVTMDGGKIEADTVDTAQLKAGSVIATTIATNAVVAGKINTNAVTATTIAAGAVVAGKINTDAVTATTIAAGAVVAGKIDTDAVTTNTIKADAVTALKIAVDAVLARNIKADNILATHIKAGEVQATHVAADALTGKQFRTSALTTVERLVMGTNAADSSIYFYSAHATETQPGYIRSDVESLTARPIMKIQAPVATSTAGEASITLGAYETAGRNGIRLKSRNINIEGYTSTGSASNGITVLPPDNGTIKGGVYLNADGAVDSKISLSAAANIEALAAKILLNGGDIAPIGEVKIWAGSDATPPTGWLVCNGQILSRTTYADLFAVLSTRYNTGGETTAQFRIPNLVGRIPVGRNAADATMDVIGETGGARNVTLTGAQSGVAQHYHQIPAAPTAGFSGTDDGPLRASGTKDNNFKTGGVSSSSTYGAGTTGPQDAAQAHENMPPFVTMSYIIRTGI